MRGRHCPPSAGARFRSSASPARASAASAAASPEARTATTRSFGPASSHSGASNPASRMISTFAGVPIIATASSTPGRAARSAEIRISATESR